MASENSYVERVGIRALQVNALAIVRRVAAGRRVTVTDGGRPVALLLPLDAALPPGPAEPQAPAGPT